MASKGGWIGKYLFVDLTKNEITVKDLDIDIASRYLGQRGLGSKMCADLMPDVNIDPLSPENPFIIMTGPLTGLYGLCNGRYEVVTKSPLTGTIAGSNSGGYWGPELKFAGYDGIVFIGKSDKPVYLFIEDDKVELRDAAHVWGKDTYETVEILKHETHEEAMVLNIGPAGEKLSRIAAVMNELYRAAARSGVGAVMGSKNLKAVVVRGTGEIQVADYASYIKKTKQGFLAMKEAGDIGGGLSDLGTTCLVNLVNESGATPVRNFQAEHSGAHPEYEKVSGETLAQTYLVKNKGCFGCPISCGRVSKVPNGKYAIEQSEGLEYETVWGFSANCGAFDLAAALKANYLCNKVGVDTISMAGTVSCAMELYEKGYIPEGDTQYPLPFGDVDAMIQLIEDTGDRKGLGDKLAEGSYRLAAIYGHPECAVTVKKQEFPGYDPRAGQGVGLSYATSNRGACHVRANLTDPELTMHTLDQGVTEGKGEYVSTAQTIGSIYDSVGMCCFPVFTITAADIAEMLTHATGVNFTEESIMDAGSRIWTFERLLNIKMGILPEEDNLPDRLTKEPLQQGSMKGCVNELDKMLPEYYKHRGYDDKGYPTRQTIERLQLTNETKVL